MKNSVVLSLLAFFLLQYSSTCFSETLTLGVHPYKSVSKLQQYYLPLTKYLSKKLNADVQLNIAKDYKTHIDLIGNDEIDIAYMGPASYVDMVKQYGNKRLLVRQVINGKPTFKGQIFTRSDLDINSLSQLKNKKFAFGDAASTMSHLVPRYMLINSGVNKDNLAEMSFLGSHDNVAIAVLSGAFDAGAVKEAVFYKYEDRGLKSLSETPELSEHLYVVSNKVSEENVERIKNIMMEMKNDAEGMKVLKGIKKTITEMGSVSDKDYDNLREILGLLTEKGIL